MNYTEIFKKHGFSATFPKEVTKEAQSKAITPHDFLGRVDLTALYTITIDGEDSKDFDDAISLEKHSTGYTLFVHIADVAHFVTKNSALDKEALHRGTSVYFPGGVLPMLPETLSNNLCSLVPGEKRLALTAKMSLDLFGEVVKSEIFESVIINDNRMTYTQVEGLINNKKSPFVNLLSELHTILYAKKIARGAIEFSSRESKITLDDKGEPVDIKTYPYGQSNSMIEEFMVLTNSVVAQKFEELGVPFVYRVHQKPSGEKLEELKEVLNIWGHRLGRDKTPHAFQRLLKKVAGTKEEKIISRVALRSMQKAVYKITPQGHFGLSLEHYCHFTSPIRRYPDLMIHRIIKSLIQSEKDSGSAKKGKSKKSHPAGKMRGLKSAAEFAARRSSEREKEAELVERDIKDIVKAKYMHRFLGEDFEGIISGVTNFGFFVELPSTCEGLVHVRDLPGGGWRFDEKRFSLKNRHKTYTFGDKVHIKVVRASENGRVDFVIHHPPAIETGKSNKKK